MNVLVLEDEKKINEMLTLYVTQEGHEVYAAFEATEALRIFREHPIDLIVTDLMLPKMQGEVFVEEIRHTSDVYIIVLTAKTTLESKLELLGKGADDYLYKPFSIDELLLKLKNIESRIKAEHVLALKTPAGRLTIKEKTNRVLLDGERVSLNNTEYRILRHMARHAEQILSRNQIIEACLRDSEAFDRIIDVYVKNLRKKIGPDLIETVYGAGYRLRGEKHG